MLKLHLYVKILINVHVNVCVFSLYVASSTSKCKQDTTNLSKHVMDLGSVHFHNVSVFCKTQKVSMKYIQDVGGFVSYCF